MGFRSIIDNPSKQQEYMRDVYSKFWNKSRMKYGFEQYDKDLIKELSNYIKNGKILEVGIGDGHPFADQFDKMGYQVYGIDIAPTHVAMVKRELPNVMVDVGDAQNLEFPDDFFDGVYCVRSSWYFPDLEKSIREMLRVLKKNGLLMFDIQNLNHPIHSKGVEKLYKRRTYPLMLEVLLRFSKNVIKLFLRPIKYYQCDWSIKKHVVISSSPTDPYDLKLFFNSRTDVKYQLFGVKFNDPFTLLEIKETAALEFDRLVYEVWKI